MYITMPRSRTNTSKIERMTELYIALKLHHISYLTLLSTIKLHLSPLEVNAYPLCRPYKIIRTLYSFNNTAYIIFTMNTRNWRVGASQQIDDRPTKLRIMKVTISLAELQNYKVERYNKIQSFYVKSNNISCI